MKSWWQGFNVKWSFVGNILGYLKIFFDNFCVWCSCGKNYIKLNTFVQISQTVWIETIRNGLGCQKNTRDQVQHGLWGSKVKTWKWLPGGVFLFLSLGPKVMMLQGIWILFFKNGKTWQKVQNEWCFHNVFRTRSTSKIEESITLLVFNWFWYATYHLKGNINEVMGSLNL